MKNFPRVQKKGILSARVIEGNRLQNSHENFDLVVEKQLEDDFKVHEYLNENHNEGNNTDEYLALYNTLLVKKFNKTKKMQLLKSTKARISLPMHDSKQKSSRSWTKVDSKTAEDNYYTEEEYLAIKKQSEEQQQLIEAKNQQQLEMKRILLKQITENKKTLNLLKGDIGHMITRHQSISVLESKVNKVSLVSENQLKRVSMALSKDKQEVVLRQEMQKKFNTKLKGLEVQQSKNLKKIKLNYIESMKRRKQIFDNLSLIQKECTSIEEYSGKQKQKQQKNIKTIAEFTVLNKIATIISQESHLMRRLEACQIKTDEYNSILDGIFSSEQKKVQATHTIEDVTAENLLSLQSIILQQYRKLDLEITEKKKKYNLQMEQIQQYWDQMTGLQKDYWQLINDWYQEQSIRYSTEKFSYNEYIHLVSLMRRSYKIFQVVIKFFHSILPSCNSQNHINQIHQNCSFHVMVQERLESNFSQSLIEEMEKSISSWLHIIPKLMKLYSCLSAEAKQSLRNPLKKPENNTGKIEETEQQTKIKNVFVAENEDMERSNSDEGLEEWEKCPSPKGTYCEQEKYTEGKSTISSLHKNGEYEVAKRIKTLQNIDQNYYRMIKQTIQMEKENTVKNYHFQKSFKRNKYSSQDELLEEKRFEASFSSLFKQDSDSLTKRTHFYGENMKMLPRFKKQRSLVKTAFSSMHDEKSNMWVGMGNEGKKNSSLWERQNKLKLRNKLKDVLNKI